MTARLTVLLVAAVTSSTWMCGGAGATTPVDPTPVYAYYYIWFNASSWNRAKLDYPLLGRYSSDEQTVMRQHIRLAKQAGIDGFIVSWKSTPVLDARLEKLIAVARRENFRLAVIYQGLDFERRPLPVVKVRADLELFVERFAHSKVFRGFGKPLFIWSGTWKFTAAQIEAATGSQRDAVLLLATERNPRDYRDKASLFDGDAYYWASINPDTYPGYESKLAKMSAAVHEADGLWIAPAAPGFNGRLIGHPTAVERRGDRTLRRQLDAAQSSTPDAIGLISWNEFSENTHVEPSEGFGTTALAAVADVLGARFAGDVDFDSSAPSGVQDGVGSLRRMVAALALLLGGVAVGVAWGRRRRDGGRPPSGPRTLRLVSGGRKNAPAGDVDPMVAAENGCVRREHVRRIDDRGKGGTYAQQ